VDAVNGHCVSSSLAEGTKIRVGRYEANVGERAERAWEGSSERVSNVKYSSTGHVEF